MINPMDLSGKLILVTGASSGIGRQTCITLSKLGAHVVLVSRNEEGLRETLSMMEDIGHKYWCYDLSKVDGIADFVMRLVDAHGMFDGFVHCAGVSDTCPLGFTTYERIERAARVNLYSFVEIVRVITKKGNFNNGGSIVAISSVATTCTEKGKTAYCVTKGALDGVILPLAIELGEKKRIRVNTVNPGWVKTEMYDNHIETCGSEKVEAMLEKHIFGLIKPEEVSSVIAFLLSPAAGQITGQSIRVDGGFAIHA